jgi:CxxC-x17-CxxC domain-containing protein
MDFQDRSIQCIDCKGEFIFSAGEQEFYERKGFRELPKRCKPRREARKNRRGSPQDQDGNRTEASPTSRGRDGRRPRELFDAVCAACGVATQVPFKPAGGRPVYCRECYGSRQGQGSGL